MRLYVTLCTILMLGTLVACRTDRDLYSSAKTKCTKYGCVSIKFHGEIQSTEPASFTVAISTEKNIPDLFVSISSYGFDNFQVSKSSPEAIKIKEDDGMVGWIIGTEAGIEYEFDGQVIVPNPPFPRGMFSYSIRVIMQNPRETVMIHEVSVFIDGNGNQMDPESVKEYLGTEVHILPNETGVIIFPTSTPNPTIRIPSGTTTPPPTPTRPAYPPPGEIGGRGAGVSSEPVLTQTLAGYPSP